MTPRSADPAIEAHVRVAVADEGLLPHVRRQYESVLDAGELERYRRYRFEPDAISYLVAHALLRTMLSHSAAVGPGEWRFADDEHGRPHIIVPGHRSGLRFNLSHTRGLVACVVSTADCGIDVEQIGRVEEPVELAHEYFAPPEIADLDSLDAQGRHVRFCEYWTLKEAYLKARGLGLGLPLDGVCFSIKEGGVSASFAPRVVGRGEDWQFHLSRPTAGHVLAVAVRRIGGRDCIILPQFTVPLGQ